MSTPSPQTPELTRRESVVVDADPDTVWRLVTSIERTGECEPGVHRLRLGEPYDGPEVGACETTAATSTPAGLETRSQVGGRRARPRLRVAGRRGRSCGGATSSHPSPATPRAPS